MQYSPTVRGRRLIREIERLRHASGLSMEAAARSLGWSASKMYRLENGRSKITTDDLADMLDLYAVRPPQRDDLIQLAREARKRGWWTSYPDVFNGSYISMEAEAASIRISASLIPGLLQTPGYAQAIIISTRPAISPADAGRRVTARLARQKAIRDRDQPPSIDVILDEAALRRQVGGPDILHQQLTELIAATTRPDVVLRVLPFDAGGHAGMDGSFTLFTFPDPADPAVAYIEGLVGDLCVEESDEVGRYELAWNSMLTQAHSPALSAELIRRAIRSEK